MPETNAGGWKCGRCGMQLDADKDRQAHEAARDRWGDGPDGRPAALVIHECGQCSALHVFDGERLNMLDAAAEFRLRVEAAHIAAAQERLQAALSAATGGNPPSTIVSAEY